MNKSVTLTTFLNCCVICLKSKIDNFDNCYIFPFPSYVYSILVTVCASSSSFPLILFAFNLWSDSEVKSDWDFFLALVVIVHKIRETLGGGVKGELDECGRV